MGVSSRAALVLACLLSSGVAQAVPAFARRYQTSCSTCHTEFPQLNPFGEAFRRNGYQFPAGADADAIQQPQLKVVSEARRALWPYSFWPSEIPGTVPLAVILESAIPITPDAAQTITFDRLYAGLAVVAAARLGKDVSIFAALTVDSEDGVELTRAMLVFSNLIRNGGLHLRIGQLEPQVFSFSDYRRLGGPTYQLTTRPTLGSQWNFDVLRGIFLSGTIRGRIGWDAAYGQGVEGEYMSGLDQLPLDGYLHVYGKIGGLRLDGVERPEGASERERSLTLGGFVYAGKHHVDGDGDPATPPESDVLLKTGADLSAIVGSFELLAAAAWERHELARSGTRERTQTLLELSWRPVPWVAGIARAEMEIVSGNVGMRVTPILSVHPRINLKMQIWAQVEKEPTSSRVHLAEVDIVGRYAF
jgi:hypothetical protein